MMDKTREWCEAQFKTLHNMIYSVMRKRRYSFLIGDEDAEQEGRAALWRAITTYDPAYGISLPSYAESGISAALKEYLRYKNKYIKIFEFLSEHYNEAEHYGQEPYYAVMTENFIETLSGQKKDIVNLLIFGYKPKEIAAKLGITRRTVNREIQRLQSKWIKIEKAA